MSNWQGINENTWSCRSDKIFGYGGGTGKYRTSYALDLEGNPFLNGKISSDIKINETSLSGAGLVCRADEMWTYLALYAYTATSTEGKSTVLRIAVFKQGAFLHIKTLKGKIELDKGFNHFSLDFFSGQIRGEIATTKKTYTLECLVPHIPFPGYVGLIRFYGTGIIAQNIKIERINYPLIPLVKSDDLVGKSKTYTYDVFISHASNDKPIVEKIVQDFKNAGISYWVDYEQIKFGDPITNKIEEGLAESKSVLVCISSSLGRSNWSMAEYGPILNRQLSHPSGKRVIPLRLDNCNDEDIPNLLYNLKRAEYSNKKEYNDLLTFLKT